MSLAADIVTALKAISAVTEIVGSGTSARIEPDEPDESTAVPLIFYDLETYEATGLDGACGSGFATLTLTCRADERKDAAALAKAVRDGLTTSDDVSAVLEDEVWAAVPHDDKSGRAYRDVVQTYQVYYAGE